LIQGDSGTGKELVAREIQRNGLRRKKPYLTENCAAIAETLLESELFGHVKGAFTGAERDHAGLFVQADGGTLFLDEIGDMPPSMQARLLRVLEEGEVRPVGSERRQHVDVRVLAATHRDLEAEVAAGRFREDLFYRLQVLVIQVPRLADRPGDVHLLTRHFLERTGREMGRKAPRIEARVMEMLERCDWPGNVRQLENAVQRLVLLAGESAITPAHVESDPGLRAMLLAESSEGPVFSLERNEKEQIEEALRASGGNRARAAQMLGISRATIFRKIKTYGLN
jgi:two-component system response regulator HydG